MNKNSDELSNGVTWVVVANASKAQIFSRQKRYSPLEAVQQLSEPDARAREQDLTSDSPGRAFDSGGRGRHAMEPDHSAKAHLLTTFAQQIADALTAAHQTHDFDRLVIVAAPTMLGELRHQLGDPVRRKVYSEFDKDLTGQAPGQIAALIDGRD